jgi:hypothetical protein
MAVYITKKGYFFNDINNWLIGTYKNFSVSKTPPLNNFFCYNLIFCVTKRLKKEL